MNCDELRDQYELYTLGLADEPERQEIREHLDRGCEVCMREVKKAREMMTLIGGSAAPAVPSAKLRKRILASVGVEQRRIGWAPFLAGLSAMSIAAAVYFGGREADFSKQVLQLREQSRNQSIELTRMSEAMAIINGADTTVTSFGDTQPKPKGKVFANPKRGILLIASNLPEVPAGKAYELWFIRAGKPVRAGMFRSESDGTAMHLESGSFDSSTTMVAVTLEVEAGVDAPTTPILFAASLPPALQ